MLYFYTGLRAKKQENRIVSKKARILEERMEDELRNLFLAGARNK